MLQLSVASLVFLLGIVTQACGMARAPRSTNEGVSLILAGRVAYTWPATIDSRRLADQLPAQGLIALGYLQNGAWHTDAQGVATRRFFGSRYGDASDPSGLLSLPRSLVLKRCNVRHRLISFTETVQEAERQESLAPGILSFDEVVLSDQESCDVLPFLDCAQAVFAVRALERGQPRALLSPERSFELSSQHPFLQVRRKLDACARPSVFARSSDGKSYFDIQGDAVLFAPERVFSILIFDEVFENLAAALSAKAPVASFSPKESDESKCKARKQLSRPQDRVNDQPVLNDLACLSSPVALSECTGCENLGGSGDFAVYLIERPGLLNETILPIVLRFE